MNEFFNKLFNKTVQKGTGLYRGINEAGSNVYRGLNEVYNRADRAVGGHLPGGVTPQQVQSRPRQTQPAPRQRQPAPRSSGFNPIEAATTYIQEIPEKGAIPIFSLTPTDEALKTAAKYAAGPLGRQMRIIRSPGTSEQLQKQIDAASIRDGQLIYGLGEPGYEATRFPSNVQGAGIVGQFIGRPTEDNRVVVEEPYDTKPSQWHLKKFTENLKQGDLINAAESAGNIAFAKLGETKLGGSTWANMYPRGRVQDIGEIKPGHPFYRSQQ